MDRMLRNPNAKIRRVMDILAAVWILLGVCLCVAVRFATGSLALMEAAVLLVTCGLASLVLRLVLGTEYPDVTLTEQGIVCPILFRSRFIPWSRIREAGIEQGGPRLSEAYRHVLVLVVDDGKKRSPRNTIRLVLSPEAVNMVTAFYGGLDYDRRS